MTDRHGAYSSVSCSTLHMRDYDRPHIVLAVWGPSGGTRCAEALALDEAKKLRDRLNDAIREVEEKTKEFA